MEQKSEAWMATADCDVYSMPAIQSPIIQNNLLAYYYQQDNRQQLHKQLKHEDVTNLKALQDFIVEDEHFKSYTTP